MTDETTSRPAAHWFEIPATDMDRASTFYAAILEAPLKRESFGGIDTVILPYQEPAIGGNLSPGVPSLTGTLIYLNCAGRLDAVLARVAPAGGEVLQPAMDLPGGFGRIAHIRDSEGNRVGLHSP